MDNPAVNMRNVLNQMKQGCNGFGWINSSARHPEGSVSGFSPSVGYTYVDGSQNTIRPTGMVYPNGRELSYDYGEGGGIDERCSRIASIIDDDETHLADYLYLGLGTFVEQESLS